MSRTTRLVTADELERMPEDDYRYELVRGRLIRMSPVAPRHGGVTMTIGALLWQHVKPRKLGRVWNEVGFRLASNPDTVRAPDVSFVRSDRLPLPEARGFYRGAPDLAVEVLSPDDSPADVREKVSDYLTAGTPVIVVVDPDKREAIVYRPRSAAIRLRTDDAMDLGSVVTGFSVRVGELFE